MLTSETIAAPVSEGENTMNKQIEEMAKALTKYEYKLCERLPKDKCLLTSAIHAQVSCDYCKIAEFLVNAGYRKQSEGEWKPCGMFGDFAKCSLCGYDEPLSNVYDGKHNYCTNCGAKMKGGAEE